MKIKLTSLYLISIFKNILKDEVFQSFTDFIRIMDTEADFDEILKKYLSLKEELNNLLLTLQDIINYNL